MKINTESPGLEVTENDTIDANSARISLNQLGILTGSNHVTMSRKLTDLPCTKGPRNSSLYLLKDALRRLLESNANQSPNDIRTRRLLAETRLAEARASKVEQEFEANARTLVPIDEVRKIYGDLVHNFRSRILALPVKAAWECVGLQEPGEIQELLTRHVHEALGELSKINLNKKDEGGLNG